MGGVGGVSASKSGAVAPSAAEKYNVPHHNAKAAAASTKHSRKRQRLPPRAILHLAHRFLILVAAVAYIGVSLSSVVFITAILDGDSTPTTSGGPYGSQALLQGVGTTGPLRNSPLVVEALVNDTRVREGTLYLELNGSSFERCDVIRPAVNDIYSDAFLRSLYAALVRDVAYNLTFLSEIELIVPVVDCTSDLLVGEDETIGLFNLLVRKRTRVDDVYMLSVTFANQGYSAFEQKTQGPAGVVTLTLVNDLDAASVDIHYLVSTGYPFKPFDFRVYDFLGITSDGLWELRKIPNGDPNDLPKVLRTGTRSGFFVTSEVSQANLFSELWEVSSEPLAAITGCDWVSKSVLADTWAWVHYVHIFFALELASSLVVLTAVSYSNFLSGKFWIGDAFVSVSRRGALRALLVLLTWYINGFWTLFEFVIYDTSQYSDLSHLAIHDVIIFTDLITIYLGICGLLGKICRERVDPLLAILSFVISYSYRFEIKHWFPSLVEDFGTFYAYFYDLASPDRVEGQMKISPMRFWSVHALSHSDIPVKFIFLVLSPMIAMLALVVLMLCAKKLYRHYYPDPLHIQAPTNSRTTGMSTNESALHAQKSVLTLFEIATGAKLANRFGLLAEYDNCLFIKGMKFATPDGVYSNGFVIVNQRFLIQATDIWTILIMKLLRTRFTNVYMYEVQGSTVDKVARLVYPSSLTLLELLHLNTNILS